MKIDYNRLTTDNNQKLTQSLFYEYRHQTKSEYMPFTLREKDFDTYISVYRVYMEADSEYEAAMYLLNSWEHWQVLCSSPFFKRYLDSWRQEREVKECAVAVKTLMKEAQAGNVTAAKALLDKNLKTKGAGRPSKEQINKEVKRQAEVHKKVSSIVDRMSKF